MSNSTQSLILQDFAGFRMSPVFFVLSETCGTSLFYYMPFEFGVQMVFIRNSANFPIEF